ncbi:MAG: flagellar biosynthesis protein FlhA [Planctomycetota bacterium]
MMEKLRSLALSRGTMMTALIVFLPVVLIQPLPPFVLDLLLSVNLALAILVMLTCMYIRRPLEFSVFPSLLLILTLFRLVLNVASTRLILSQGYAGGVISAFSEFVAGGNLVIGIVIFVILVVIQFVVITKGATRIAEVSARFTLDAMPGKQMAIDADLNSGLIDEKSARARRQEITMEAEFYGAMDGASKFVRGDAIAGIVITLINVFGGIISGMVLLKQDIWTALETFVKLSIGDGLVSSMPAFIIALASGLLITRTASQDSLGEELLKQIFKDKKPILISSVTLIGLAFTGLPTWPLLALGGGLILITRSMDKRERREMAQATEVEKKQQQDQALPRAEKFLDLDAMELEMGYGLIRLCDAAKGGDLVERIRMIRQQMAGELGFIVPSVRIRDNMNHDPHTYIVKIKGVEAARGAIYPDEVLAMDTGAVNGTMQGRQVKEPAFGMKAVWIAPVQKDRAEAMGYHVVDAASVLVTHLIEILRAHGHELLTRQETANLIKNLEARSPKVVEDCLKNNLVTMGDVQRVLQCLLKERVSIRDLETILETITDYAPRLRGEKGPLDLETLAEYVRVNLGRAICHSVRGSDGSIHVVLLEPRLEDHLIKGLRRNNGGHNIELPEEARQAVAQAIARQIEKMMSKGHPPVLVVDPSIRRHVRKLMDRSVPSLTVLSTLELPSDIELSGEGAVMMPEAVRAAG